MAALAASAATEINALIGVGALFVVNHSGGKDSQAMMIRLQRIIPASQMLVVHASLGEVEWPGALELAEKQAADAGVPFIVAKAVKTFFEMVEHRFSVRPSAPSWPSADNRQCTSDLKRGPIEREVRRYAKAHGFTMVVNCMGLRAQESASRARQIAFRLNERNTIVGRNWYDWLPIHDLSAAKVFETIAAAGQEPHYAYALGNQRLSCVFCIQASKSDLINGAKHNPQLLAKYIQMEERTGYTMHQSRVPLKELVAIPSPVTGVSCHA